MSTLEFTTGSELVVTELVVVGASVTIGGATRSIDALNPERRDTNQLVVFTPEYGTSNKQNKWGFDATVVGGVVTRVDDLTSDVAIPEDGYLLSGHRDSRDWLKTNAKVGSRVTLTGIDVPDPEEPVDEELAELLEQLRQLLVLILEKL